MARGVIVTRGSAELAWNTRANVGPVNEDLKMWCKQDQRVEACWTVPLPTDLVCTSLAILFSFYRDFALVV